MRIAITKLKLRRLRPSPASGIAVTALVIAATGTAIAAIPGSGGVIQSCYNTANGNLRVIDGATTTCGANETALSWNQAGPQGPKGDSGAQGPRGLPGINVPLTARSERVIANNLHAFAGCNADEIAVSGGYSLPSGVTATASFREYSRGLRKSGWGVTISRTIKRGDVASVIVYCAPAPPAAS